MKQPRRPKDSNSRAVYIAQLATGEIQEPNPNEGKNMAAVELGRLGAKARNKNLTPRKRKAIAKKAAKKRWGKS